MISKEFYASLYPVLAAAQKPFDYWVVLEQGRLASVRKTVQIMLLLLISLAKQPGREALVHFNT